MPEGYKIGQRPPGFSDADGSFDAPPYLGLKEGTRVTSFEDEDFQILAVNPETELLENDDEGVLQAIWL